MTPNPVSNCSNCNREIRPGQLICPTCGALTYAQHLKDVNDEALRLESQSHWAESRDLWRQSLVWVPPNSHASAVIQQRIDALDQKVKQSKPANQWAKRLGPLAPILVFLGKFKTAFLLLFKLKFLLSFFAFFGIYWALYGFWFGAGFAFSIMFHEFGHYVAIKRLGLKADLPVFLPGMGAYVRWEGMGVSLANRSLIALAGPAAGLLAGTGFLGAYYATGLPAFAAVAHAGAWLNVLNLIPVFVFDGAHATYALNRMQRFLLLLTCVILGALLGQPMYFLVALGMTWRLFTRDEPAESSNIVMAFFIALLFALGLLFHFAPSIAFHR